MAKEKKDQVSISRELGTKHHVHIKKRFSATEGHGHRSTGRVEKPRKHTPSVTDTCPAGANPHWDPHRPDSAYLWALGVPRTVSFCIMKGTSVARVCAFVINHCMAHSRFAFHCM